MPDNNILNDAKQVAVAGSPSTNYEVTLNLLANATKEPLVGNMLFLTHESGEGLELGLGMVTTVTTENQWHNNTAMLGIVKNTGTIPGMSGDSGDIRKATIKIQAAFRNTEKDGTGKWTQSGPTMRMSPPTGVAIRQTNETILDSLVDGIENIHYLGTQHGSDIRVPFNIRDFNNKRGSFHQIYVGISGSGKTALACYALAGQLRNPDHGLIIIDPQGQFSTSQALPFDLSAFAEELGREVTVRRISEDLQLPKDALLFGELLLKTKFAGSIMKMSKEIEELVIDELVKALKSVEQWESTSPDVLLDELLRKLRRPNVLRLVYADNSKRLRLMVALSELLGEDCEQTIDGDFIEDINAPEYRDYRLTEDGVDRRKTMLSTFQPLHNLFSPTNPSGGRRHSLWGTISRVFDRETRGNNPAPVLILDMSTNSSLSWIHSILADEDQTEVLEALKVLEQDDIKATILRQVVGTLKHSAESSYKTGETLNVQVVLDEAYRFVPPTHQARYPEVKLLSEEIAIGCRDMRKYGVGWTFITQTVGSVNSDVWSQISVRYIGYGLAGADIDKIAEQLDDRDHLQLYKGFAPPDSSGIYPWMLTGPVSPLSSGKTPIFLAAYTDFERFREHNNEWITQARLAQGKTVLSGPPSRVGDTITSLAPRTTRANRPSVTPPRGRTAAEQMERIRANRETGGVDPAAGIGLSADTGFSNALDLIDDGQPPF